VGIHQRKSEQLGKKVSGQGEGEEEEDGVGYVEEDFFLKVEEERQKSRDGAASMTSLL